MSNAKKINVAKTYKEKYGRVIYSDQSVDKNNPYNIPDWRIPSEYLPPTSLSPAQWRWEFLRRSAPYREFWDHLDGQMSGGWVPDSELDYHTSHFFLTKLIDPRLDTRAGEPDLFVFHHHFVYDVGPFENFDIESYQALRSTEIFPSTLDEFVEVAQRNQSLLVAINCEAPLAPQFELVKEVIKGRSGQRNACEGRDNGKRFSSFAKYRGGHRGHPNKYTIYLRLLDARDKTANTNASWREIETALLTEKCPFYISRDSLRRLFSQAVDTQKTLASTPMIK